MKNILIVLCLLAMTAFGKADALEYGADVNRGPCPIVYQRSAPGFCTRNTEDVIISGEAPNGACRFVVLDEIPANAKTVSISYIPRIVSLNSVGLSQSVTVFYSDFGCSNNYQTIAQYAYEFVATLAGTLIGGVSVPIQNVPIVNGRLYYKAFIGDGFQNYTISVNGFTD